MFYRSLTFFTLLLTSLYAQPNMAQIQQAVSANPALLNTPQAKAAMAEKGVTVEQVKQKLSETGTTVSTTEATTESAQNEIDMAETEQKIDENSATTDEVVPKENISLTKRVNPFAYKTNADLKNELDTKQQSLITTKLARYSTSFFANKNNIDISSLPTPENYLVSTGDVIRVHVYGDRNKEYSLTVKNDATVEIEFIGPVKIGGLTFKDAKKSLQNKLKAHFKMSSFNISMSNYSTIQVTLIGDVKSPGIYNLSSFSTVKDLLIASHGVAQTGSVRDITIRRGSKVIAKMDFYDLLFKAKQFSTTLLKQGDVISVGKAKKLVSIDGFVNHAAIFELNRDETLSKLIEYAGGMKPNASKHNIKISRYSQNLKTEVLTVSYQESKNIKMKDGDSIYIYPLDFTAKSSINIYGNVIRPGAYRIVNGETLNKFLSRSIKDGYKKFFLPHTYFEYGVIKSYSKDLTYKSKSFNLANVLNGSEEVNIQANDELYIFNQNDIYTSSYVTTVGSLLIKSGKLNFLEGMTIEDAINASGINGVVDDRVRVTTYNTDNFMPKTTFYSLKNEGNMKLSAYDEVEVYDYYSKHILEPVSISGEVVKNSTVYHEKGMTLQNILDIAGGYTKKAYTKSLSITRYYVDKTQTRQQKIITVNLENTQAKDVILEPYDEITVSPILGWGAQDYETVTISGEVNNPITVKYGKGMRLNDLLVMAQGLTKTAYTKKLEIIRYHIDKNQTRQREVIVIEAPIKEYANITLDPYDEVRIFKIPKWGEKWSVTLGGEVKFPGTYTIDNGEKLSSIIKRAGGYTDNAFIEAAVFTRESIRANQIQQYNQSLSRIKRQLAVFNAMPANSKAAVGSAATMDSLNEVVKEAEKYQPIGRISIELDANLTEFEQSPFNVTLKDKDSIFIPGNIDTVTVFGEVFNPTSFVYNENKDSYDYIEMASGLARAADESRIYVIHANGTSEPATSGLFSSSIDIQRGDTVVVPIYVKEYNTLELWDSVAKIMSSFALTAAAVNSLGVI
ncbi:hypothetical protein GJV85_09785 [Sulfurimonas aquatica]|uniref:Uncharacterized protein n=1 Tax=Sulfurimonas aquatica TaxID=2672570 RepID=A0A975GDI0_9BACT|nr:SLBB domain-containing protein [Sulfurimonas aquatica]QSZ42383.1 hypothetical protein GJV85_09785 [Sulfurimonas aquatica]